MRLHSDGALLGSSSVCWKLVGSTSDTMLFFGSGLICSATTTNLLIDVPGGSQVIRVMVLSLLEGPKTETSLGETIFFSKTL